MPQTQCLQQLTVIMQRWLSATNSHSSGVVIVAANNDGDKVKLKATTTLLAVCIDDEKAMPSTQYAT